MKKTNASIPLSILVLSTAALAGCIDEEPMAERESLARSSAGAPPEQHCTIEVSAQRAGEPAVTAAPAARCYGSFAEAISAATHGKVQLAPDMAPDMLERLDRDQATTLGTYIVAIEYVAPRWDSYWGSKIFTSSVTCDQGYTLWVDNLVPYGWNDVISSAKTYSGCLHGYHYEHAYFGGAVLDCPSNPEWNCYYDMGAMNDRTSSIRWSN